MFAIARKFFDAVIPGIIKPLRVLWNEMIAFTFFLLAAMAVPSTYKAIRNFKGDTESLMRITLTGLFIAVMAGYGFYSVFRARKIGKG